ncbi:MAG: glycoside hydrolase family 97 catalytic domain-containing protein, partial [Bacteroidota bacterium]
ASEPHILTSPSQQVQVNLSDYGGKLRFSLRYRGDTLLTNSPLGLMINNTDYSQNIQLAELSQNTYDSTWHTINGKQPRVRNHYQAYRYAITLPDSDSSVYELVLRLYDNGLAYRYVFPEASILDGMQVTGEATQLNFVSDYTYWAFNGENHNEGPLWRSEATRDSLQIPVVTQLADSLFLALHEAGIYDFAPFTLNASDSDQSLRFNTKYLPQDTTFQTSWRTLILGQTAGELVASNLLVNLNPPSRIADVSWIKPGKSLWDWRVWGYTAPDGYVYGLNTESHKRLIDFAADNNVQYLLIDADWYGSEFSAESNPTTAREGIVIEEAMAYAKERDVGLILYLNDVGAKQFGLERVLKQFADWGAVGVKYGFMKGTPEEKVRHTHRVVELCAKYRLMVNFHDNPVPPSGDRRTWPNLVTREYGHAQADSKRSYYPETAVNQVLLNMIAGPIDMTNGWFDLNGAHAREKVFEEIPGTVAAEVAKLIAIYTGWMVLPDAPEAYLAKADLFEAIRQIPPQFDSLGILDGELDEYVSVVRRAGEEWLVGSLTNREARQLTIKLDFLCKDKQYLATLYEDAPDTHFLENKETYHIQRDLPVTADSVIMAPLAPGGGHAIWIRPNDTEY